MMPYLMLEEDFLIFINGLEEYYGVSYQEAKVFRDVAGHPLQEGSFNLCKCLSYFVYKCSGNATDDEKKAEWEDMVPILKTGKGIYLLDPTITVEEMLRLYAIFQDAVPQLMDTWYYETFLHMDQTEQEYAAIAEDGYTDYSGESFIKSFTGLGETVTDIQWSSNVVEIDALTFVAYKQLKTVMVPETVEFVGEGAFAFCDALEEITFSEGVRQIGSCVLYGCEQLKTVRFPASLEKVELNWFNASQQSFPDIHYGGTTEQWLNFFQPDPWGEVDYGVFSQITVYCTDGVIEPTLDQN
jgi:hypothetical protein